MLRIPGRIPIAIHPFFWLMALLIGWLSSWSLMGTLIWAGVILFSLLVHEMGHAITARLFGARPRIELTGFGGMTIYEEGTRVRGWRDFLVVLNGPLAGLLLFAIAFLIVQLAAPTTPWLRLTLGVFIWVNLFWTLFNLLPVGPLDGGRLLAIALEIWMGVRGIRLALLIGVLVGVLCTALFFITGLFIPGIIFVLLTYEAIRSFQMARRMSDQDREPELQEQLRTAEKALDAGDEKTAVHLLEEVREHTHAGLLHQEASEELALVAAKEGNWEQVYQNLIDLKDNLSGQSICLLHQAALAQKDYVTATELGDACYQQDPTDATALTNALAHAALGHERPALGWLRLAAEQGAINLEAELSRPEFDPLRDRPSFQKALKKISPAG
jgi:stage IV sporulation protein FB